MQDRYISLDPALADSSSHMVRKSLYWQRLNEAAGGQAATLVAAQIGVTASVLSYSSLRSSGFRTLPIQTSKVPKYGQVLFAGFLGWNFGSSFVYTLLGDSAQYNYLVGNKSAILSGEKSLNWMSLFIDEVK